MSGALELLKKILQGGGREARAMERRIGEEFYRAADETPDMFQRGREYAPDRDGLQAQFGVHFADNGSGDTLVGTPGQRTAYAATMSEFPYSVAVDPQSALTAQAGIAGRSELYGPSSRFIEFDTSGLNDPMGFGGGGAGRGVYAAMYGSLLDDPNKMNFASRLSRRNEHRRNYNQAAALLRDPRLSKQILIDPYQYDGANVVRDRPEPQEFMRRPPEDQVGAMQALGALQLYKRLGSTINHADTYPEKVSQLRSTFGDLLAHEEDPRSFAAGANLLRSSGAPSLTYDTIGASALRRAALVSDIVGERPGGLRRSLLHGLEYRRGGSV